MENATNALRRPRPSPKMPDLRRLAAPRNDQVAMAVEGDVGKQREMRGVFVRASYISRVSHR